MRAHSISRLEFPQPDVATIVLDHPERGVNLLSSQLLDEIERHLDSLAERHNLAGLIIISGKPDTFLAGADLSQIAAKLERPREEILAACLRGRMLFSRLSQLPCVSIAAIDGVCLGGGAELSVWCDRRIVTRNDKTSLGFPEVKLGLIPGWGGTARTPRLIGLANAVQLITSGEPIDATTAYKLGLADDLVETEDLLASAIRMIRQEQESDYFVCDRQQHSKHVAMSETELAFLGATASAFLLQKTGGHYPAPQAALDLVLEASKLSLEAACHLEAERFANLFGSSVNRALLNVYFLQERSKKLTNRSEFNSQITSVAILGAGIMGSGIAAANLRRGFKVILHDQKPAAQVKGLQSALRDAAYNKQTKQTDATRTLELSPNLLAVNHLNELHDTDLVIEAISESLAAKQALLSVLETVVYKDTILCSNTSTIPISALAKELRNPNRFCGLHFFNPVRKMQLVEVIRGAATSDKTIESIVAYARHLGKVPIVVRDGPGFLVNRLLMPYMNEAALLLEDGIPIAAIDKAAKSFGMPMGPFELYDMVGLDTCLHAGKVMQQSFPDRVQSPKIVTILVEANRLGQKNGRGFYDYQTDSNGRLVPCPSPAIDDFVETISTSQSESRKQKSEIQDRLFLPMLLEATRVLEERLVDDVRDIDLALLLGIGFPPFRGGLFYWADFIGTSDIMAKLDPLQTLGQRYKPTPLLLDRHNRNARFYD